MSVSCCVLFNHPYPPNIPFLRDFYKRKYDDVLFIQPMVKSSDPDVYTSYRGSYTFHGMIADLAETLLSRDSEYFVFVHDDVLLNPLYDGAQLVERLNVQGNGAFIPHVFPLSRKVQDWAWVPGFLWRLFYPINQISGSGITDLMKYFPDAQQIKLDLKSKYNFEFEDIQFDRSLPIRHLNVVANEFYSKYITKAVLDGLYVTAPGTQKIELPFPFVGGNCDFVVLDRRTLEASIPLLGVTAAASPPSARPATRTFSPT
ncbi:hypothetical protein OMR07_10590 [Methylobacterium organophilum]|nr:hypothetical protein [Methylobacterium organophilum]